MGALRSREVRGPVTERAPISGVRPRVLPPDDAPVSISPISLPRARVTAVANANDTRASIPDGLPLEEAVPLSADAALAVIFAATVAFAGGVFALLPLI